MSSGVTAIPGGASRVRAAATSAAIWFAIDQAHRCNQKDDHGSPLIAPLREARGRPVMLLDESQTQESRKRAARGKKSGVARARKIVLHSLLICRSNVPRKRPNSALALEIGRLAFGRRVVPANLVPWTVRLRIAFRLPRTRRPSAAAGAQRSAQRLEAFSLGDLCFPPSWLCRAMNLRFLGLRPPAAARRSAFALSAGDDRLCLALGFCCLRR